MTFTSSWRVAGEDEHSRQSFLSDCDSELDFSPFIRSPDERRSISALRKLSINHPESPLTRSRAKATGRANEILQSTFKEQRRSTIRHSIDSFTGKAATLTHAVLFPKQQWSDNPFPNSPSGGVNSLTNWLESCSLDEMSTTRCRTSRDTTSHCMRQTNSFSLRQMSSFLVPSATTSLNQQQTQRWPGYRFATPTTHDHRHSEPLNSFLSAAQFTAPINTNNNNNLSQPVSTALCSPQQPSIAKLSPQKEGRPHKHLSFSAFSTLLIFIIGLVLGYLLTNTCPSNLFLHWLLVIWSYCAQLTIEYVHLLHVHLQPMLKNCSSFFLV